MRNYTIRHVKNSDYIIKIKNVENDSKFTFSHYFCRKELNNNAIAVYKSENAVVLIRKIKSYNSRNDRAIYLTKKDWSKVVSQTDDMNEAESLSFLLKKLKKYFFFANETAQEQDEREYQEFLKNGN